MTYKILLNNISINLVCGEKITWQALSLQIQHLSKLVASITKDPKKQKALEAAMDQIERQFGKGAIMRLGQNELMDIEAIPTGSLSLDIALGMAVANGSYN